MAVKNAAASPPVAGLIAWYAREIEVAEHDPVSQWPWAFGRYSDGTPIAPAHRWLYREHRDLQAAFPDPYDASVRRPDVPRLVRDRRPAALPAAVRAGTPTSAGASPLQSRVSVGAMMRLSLLMLAPRGGKPLRGRLYRMFRREGWRGLRAPAAAAAMTEAIVIDVIVPVHSGLAATKRCLESLIADAAGDHVRDGRRRRRDARACDRPLPGRARRRAPHHAPAQRSQPGLRPIGQPRHGAACGSRRGPAQQRHRGRERLARPARALRRARRRMSARSRRSRTTRRSARIRFPAGWAASRARSGSPALDRLFAAVNTDKSVDLPTGVGSCLYIRRVVPRSGRALRRRALRARLRRGERFLPARGGGRLAQRPRGRRVRLPRGRGQLRRRARGARQELRSTPCWPRIPTTSTACTRSSTADPTAPLRAAVDAARIAHGGDEAASVIAERAEERRSAADAARGGRSAGEGARDSDRRDSRRARPRRGDRRLARSGVHGAADRDRQPARGTSATPRRSPTTGFTSSSASTRRPGGSCSLRSCGGSDSPRSGSILVPSGNPARPVPRARRRRRAARRTRAPARARAATSGSRNRNVPAGEE